MKVWTDLGAPDKHSTKPRASYRRAPNTAGPDGSRGQSGSRT